MPTATTPSKVPTHRELWLKHQKMREDPKIGHIVRQIEASEDMHKIRLAIQVKKTQPGAAYTPLRFKHHFRRPWWRLW